MKKSVVVGKRQILLAVLIVALAGAVYLNWHFAKTGQNYNVSDVMAGSHIGEAVFVGGSAVSESEGEETGYFAQTRTDRAKTREEETAKLKEIASDAKSDSSAVSAANERLVKLTAYAEAESNIEALVKAKGFADCVAVMTDQNVSVMVKTDGLLASDTVQIQDIAASASGYTLQNIKIVEIK